MSSAGDSNRAAALLAVAAGAVILGLAPIGVRLSEIGPQATGFWRYIFALPALALFWAMAQRRGEAAPGGRQINFLLLVGLAFGLDLALFHAAIVRTSVVNATLLSNMTPVLAVLGSWLFLRERIGWGFIMGAAVATGGAIALSLSRAQVGQGALAGDMLALFSAFFYAAYLVTMRIARRRSGVAAAMLWSTLGALAVAVVAMLALREAIWPDTLRGWAVVAGLGLVVHAGGQGLIAYGIGRLPIALSTVVLWLQPLSAAIWSWVLFGEILAPLGFIGAALLLTGVWIVQTKGRAA